MGSPIRLVFPIVSVLLFVGLCLADTATVNAPSGGRATEGLLTYYTGGSPSLGGAGWNTQSLPGLPQMQGYQTIASAWTDGATHSVLVGDPDRWVLFGRGDDHSGWTAADQTILIHALASTGGSIPRLQSQFQDYAPLGKQSGLGADCPPPPPSPSPVPEPGSLLMTGSGLVMLAGLLRRRLWRRRES